MVRTFGSGPSLLALHGFTSTGRSFTRLAASLDRLVVAPDLPGHGHSRVPDHSHRSTIDALGALCDGQTDVLGYSQGARLALALAAEQPSTVASLILISGTPGIADSGDREDRAQTDHRLAHQIRSMSLEAFIDEWTSTGITSTAHLDAETRSMDRALRLDSTPEGLACALEGFGQGAQPSYWDRLTEVEVPVLLIAGGGDTKYTQIAEQMHQDLPDSTLAIIPDAGHNPLLDQFEDTALLIQQFLG